MSSGYPFTALVGQEALKDALIWVAIDPTIGGVVISGTRGTAKSTAVRALAELLPPMPFVELPVGATEDRVIGTLDVRSLLTDAERRFEPGLLAKADRGVLYVDEVNLLPDHLVDVLLDAAATGKNVVERDGASYVHDARIVLVGTMNPEEGELRPQLLDRFGLSVPIVSEGDVDARVEIVERRMAFERDPVAFAKAYEAASTSLRTQIVRAREVLAAVTVDRTCVRHAAELALAAHAEGMRADLTMVRTARAIAAFDARTQVTIDDIERASIPALAHRRREAPQPPPPGSPPPRKDQGSEQRKENGASRVVTFDVGAARDVHVRTDAPTAAVRVIPRAVARGRSTMVTPRGRARLVDRTTATLAPLASIHVAACERIDPTTPLTIEPRHLRFIERRGRDRQLIVLLVDASGSMAAAARMRAAKGAVGAMLERAYYQRDAVALVAFRGEDAEVIVPPTRSAVLAYRRLAHLPTGGRTPLAAGLRRAGEVIAAHARRDPGARAHLVVVSDARANLPEHDAFAHAMREAADLRTRGVRALCLDTETGRIRLGNARQLAAALDAQYQHLDDCTERAMGAAVREWMAIA